MFNFSFSYICCSWLYCLCVSCSSVIYCCVLYCVVVLLYCVYASFVCNVCYLSVVLLYYCHRAEAQLQFNKYIYIYILQGPQASQCFIGTRMFIT
jgi:hypothetical protein